MASGDVMILYTDGLIEAENQEHELFGEERLIGILRENHHLHPQELINYVVDQVRFFTGHQNFTDDVSMIVLQAE